MTALASKWGQITLGALPSIIVKFTHFFGQLYPILLWEHVKVYTVRNHLIELLHAAWLTAHLLDKSSIDEPIRIVKFEEIRMSAVESLIQESDQHRVSDGFLFFIRIYF